MKITAVVVTYNRLELLKKSIECLHAALEQVQSENIECHICVINNGSTDGTHEWLDGQTDLKVIHQDNVGGSGGFYTGIKKAYEEGADWIWCMDDDVFPKQYCLLSLLEEVNKHKVIFFFILLHIMAQRVYLTGGSHNTILMTFL